MSYGTKTYLVEVVEELVVGEPQAGTSSGGPFTAGPAPLVGCVAALPVSAQTYPVIVVGGGGTAGAPADQRWRRKYFSFSVLSHQQQEVLVSWWK